jgi:hypothetical protein
MLRRVTHLAVRVCEALPIQGMRTCMLSGLVVKVRQGLARRGYRGPAEPHEMLYHIKTEIRREEYVRTGQEKAELAARIAVLDSATPEFVEAMISYVVRERREETFRNLRIVHGRRPITDLDGAEKADLRLVSE